SRWGRFDQLQERNREILREILDEAAKPSPQRDAVAQKIGDFYAACMDEKAINADGLAPVNPVLTHIRELKQKSDLPAELARLHRMGVSAIFDFTSGQDFQDATQVIAQADQGGLGLPDRDYYIKDDPESIELRHKYAAHVQKMFELAGVKPEDARAH